MERLTNKAWRNFDPWECCGQDKYCQRGCHDTGGCTKGCIVPRLYARLGAYEDTGLTPQEVLSMKFEWCAMMDALNSIGGGYTRLRELAEADKDGRVVVVPCKVGQRVFALLDTDKHISECEVKRIGMGNEIGFIGLEPIGARGREYGVALNGFGKTVFLTREEAEKALEEREGKKDGKT